MHGAGDGIEYEQALDPAVENTAHAREPHALAARPSQDLRQKAWLREEPGLCARRDPMDCPYCSSQYCIRSFRYDVRDSLVDC